MTLWGEFSRPTLAFLRGVMDEDEFREIVGRDRAESLLQIAKRRGHLLREDCRYLYPAMGSSPEWGCGVPRDDHEDRGHGFVEFQRPRTTRDTREDPGVKQAFRALEGAFIHQQAACGGMQGNALEDAVIEAVLKAQP